MNQQEYMRVINRQRNLPHQLARAKDRVLDLLKEADRLGLHELLENPASLNAAWEREIEIARLGNEPAIDRNAA